jgi:hypothetical protein
MPVSRVSQFLLCSRHFAIPIAVLALFSAGAAHAGVVVLQTPKGIEFLDALSISVNGKDKALQAGSEPTLNGPINKLPGVKLEGSLLRDVNASALVLDQDGSLVYIVPEGLPKGIVTSLANAWTDTTIAVRRAKGDKSAQPVAMSSFLAYLAGDTPELVRLCMDDGRLKLISPPGKSFDMQMRLMTAIVKGHSSDPALQPLAHYVEEAMRSRYDRFESGTATIDTLNQAIRYSELSQAVYPDSAPQKELRDAIQQKKSWLDRRIAVLHAFAAGGDWDPYILGDRDLEKYEQAYPDLADLRMKALKASLDAHRQSGEEFLSEGEYEAAYREFRLATLRQPSDKLLQQRVLMSWTDYSREVAIDSERNKKRLGVGEQEILNQAIQFATNYKNENKLDLALKSIQDAEAVDPDSLPMLLKKAEILGAQRQFSQAFNTLDQYDLRAVDDERARSSNLRNELLFKQRSSLEDIKEQIQKDWTAGDFHKLHDLALQGLKAKDDDGDLLYEAGLSSLITRDGDSGRGLLARYLDVTDTLDANPEQRMRVRALLATAPIREHTGNGDANWLSGMRLPPGTFYCPVSLAFQPQIDRIEASNKMRVNYQWNGNKLLSITPSFEKADKATDAFPQVLLASDGDGKSGKQIPADPDERLKVASVVVLNNPYIDPDAVEKLTGRNVSLGISGNRYFEPFVWDKVHYFQFRYDSEGRVSHAVELSERNGPPTGFSLDFDWMGSQLTAIRGYEGANGKHRELVYTRTMHYDEGRLVSEDIQSDGKSSKIKYNYNAGRLVSANCGNDSTLDDRSRQVFFR